MGIDRLRRAPLPALEASVKEDENERASTIEPGLKVDDRVRISKDKRQFKKGYLPNWRVRVYTVFSFFVFKFANEKRITNSFFVFKFANEKRKTNSFFVFRFQK